MIAESDCFSLEVSRARAFSVSPLVESVELGSMCLGRFEVMIGISLLSDVRPFPLPLHHLNECFGSGTTAYADFYCHDLELPPVVPPFG